MSTRWWVLAGALIPLALAGCGGNQQARQTGQPSERVAGERQEDETIRLVRQAGLPETFAFGGRTWTAHQIHWIEPTDAARSAANGRIGDFIPVAQFQVQGHQIYRQEGLDEAVTDNIFLRADNMPAPASDTSSTGDTGMDSAPGGAPAGTPSTNRIAFVEYDAGGSTMGSMELPQVLTMAGLEQRITHNGKTWIAEEVQVYDADVFDDLKPLTNLIGNHQAFQGDDKDEVYLMADVTMMPGASTTPNGITPDTTTPGTTDTAMMKGPIFIKYQAQ